MKRFFAVFMIMIILASASVFASDAETAEASLNLTPFDISAKSGVLMEQETGRILYEKNPHEKMPPASITKVMTLLLTMEAIEEGRISLGDTIVASAHACSMGGSQIWLKENEQMTVEELLKATAVASANDAAMALAEHIGGSEEGFVAMMNNRAAELSMNDTTFINPTGLDAEGHLSSAYDIAIMSKELMKHEKIKLYTTIWMDSLRGGKTELVNTNKLVRFYKGCTGLKTGTTDGAGSCVSVTAERENLKLVSVVMGSATSKERFASARQLLDYGYASFMMYTPQVSGAIPESVRVKGGISESVPIAFGESPSVIIPKGKQKEIEEVVAVKEEVEAPVKAGDKVGEIALMLEGEPVATFEIKAKENVPEMSFSNGFSILLKKLITI